jgi:hypothetical protein
MKTIIYSNTIEEQGSGPSPSDAIPLPDSDAGAAGTSTNYSRGDHSHKKVGASTSVLGMVKIGSGINVTTDSVISVSGGGTSPSPSDTIPLADSDAGAAGTDTKYSRGDHSHKKVGASTSVLGMVKIGSGINVTTDHIISAVSKKEYAATILSASSAWINGTQTITVAGIKATDKPIVDILLDEDVDVAKNELTEWAKIGRIKTAADTLVVTCFEVAPPTVDLKIQMQVFE